MRAPPHPASTRATWRAELEVHQGDFRLQATIEGVAGVLALVGPNGSGKTTVLRTLAGAIPAIRAEITAADRVLASSTQGISLPMEQRRVGYVPQGYGLFPHLSVLDNVAFGLSVGPARQPKRERHQRAAAMLDQLGCGGLADRSTSTLSGGEQQRVALARALVLEPDLLLLDEPLAALDAITRRQVRAFLVEHLTAYGRPTVLVTHDRNDVEALGASICALQAGQVVQQGSIEALRASPATPFVAELLGV